MSQGDFSNQGVVSVHVKKRNEHDNSKCGRCGHCYGAASDPRIGEDWIMCKLCKVWLGT